MKNKILILMATYNGEKYIEEQLESLLKQTNKSWDLLISDDSSNDNTIKIIEEYCKNYSNIKLLKHNPENGAIGNFSFLIKVAKKMRYKYFMFCDQDDFWLKNKIEKTLEIMKKNESKNPILVFTDKEYVDFELRSLGYDLSKYNQFDFEILLHQNVIYGCTMMINDHLMKKLDSKIPVEFINHDHYIAVMAKIFGKIYYLDYKSILYRQHDSNVSGNINKNIIFKIKSLKIYKNNLKLFFFISDFLESKYFDILEIKNKRILSDINKKIKLGGIKSILYLHKNKIRKNTLKGSVRFWIELYFWRN